MATDEIEFARATLRPPSSRLSQSSLLCWPLAAPLGEAGDTSRTRASRARTHAGDGTRDRAHDRAVHCRLRGCGGVHGGRSHSGHA